MDDVLPNIVWKRVGIELFLKSVQLRHYVQAVLDQSSDDQAQIARIIDEACRQLEAKIESAIQFEIETKGKDLLGDIEDARAVLRILGKVSKSFSGLHELLRHLPRRRPAPETIDMLRHSLGAEYSKCEPSIVLGSVFNAFEFDFHDEVQRHLARLSDFVPLKPGDTSERRPLLTLALGDRDAPFAWPVLGHEIGHSLERRADFSAKLIEGQFPTFTHDERQTLTKWSRELYADLIGARLFGSCTLFSILNMYLCGLDVQPLYENSKSHPAFLLRIQIVAEYLESCGANVEALTQEQQLCRTAATLQEKIRSKKTSSQIQKDLELLSKEFVSVVVPEILGDIQQYGFDPFHNNPDEVHRSVERFRNGLPAGAQGLPREELVEGIQDYRARSFSSRPDQVESFNQLVSRFQEKPLSPRDILVAANTSRFKLIDEFLGEKLDIDKLHDLSTKHSKVEALVTASIRMSAIHSSILREAT